ncbi:hypothetical protein Tco_0638370 [Tanacetum coccineum]
MESLNSNSQERERERERVVSIATNATQSKGKLHEIFSTYSIQHLRSIPQKPDSAGLLIGQWFSPKKSSAVHEKTMTPRSCLKWKPMGKIFKTIGLRWVPIGKIFTLSRTKVDSCTLNNLSAAIVKNPVFNWNTSSTVLISLLDYKSQQLSKGSSEGSVTPEVPDEPKDNSAVVTEKQAGYV